MYASGAGVFTPEGFAQAIEQFGASIRPSVLRALKRTAKIPRAIYIAKARKRGVLRTIFGKSAKGMGGSVKTKVIDRAPVFVLSMELRGLPAMQEIGGHTKQPRQGAIFPKFKKALALKMPGGVVVASAKHRGANIHTFPLATEALTTAAPKIQAAIDKAIAEFRYGGTAIATAAVA